MNLNNPINRLIVERGTSQTKIAEDLGVDRIHLNKVINGVRKSGPLQYRLARYFKKSQATLFPEKKNGSRLRRR